MERKPPTLGDDLIFILITILLFTIGNYYLIKGGYVLPSAVLSIFVLIYSYRRINEIYLKNYTVFSILPFIYMIIALNTVCCIKKTKLAELKTADNFMSFNYMEYFNKNGDNIYYNIEIDDSKCQENCRAELYIIKYKTLLRTKDIKRVVVLLPKNTK